MRRTAKTKALAAAATLRKAALTATAASRRSYPAWIEADDGAVPFPARAAVTPRVRDGLVLRAVPLQRSPRAKDSRHGDRTA